MKGKMELEEGLWRKHFSLLIWWLQREIHKNMKTTKNYTSMFFVEPGQRMGFCIKVCLKLERIPCRQGANSYIWVMVGIRSLKRL